MSVDLTTRNATLNDLAAMLKDQHGRQLDVVTPATQIRAENGRIILAGTEAQITEDGVTPTDGIYVPTRAFDDGIAGKLAIPTAYLRRLRVDRPDLYDANVNGWLRGNVVHGPSGPGEDLPVLANYPGDPRKFMVRAFRGDNGPGIARAFLSDRYMRIDNLDVLMATLQGIRDAGVNVEIDGADLTDSRMYVRVVAPEVAALAPVLTAGYRNPFANPEIFRVGDGGGWTPQAALRAARREGGDYKQGDEPIVFAGFVISNSETGGGRFKITPRMVLQICDNGLQMTAEAMGSVHLGGQLDEGVVEWSTATQRKQLDLITSQTADAVGKFLSPGYVAAKVEEMEQKAGKPVTEPQKVIEVVGKALSYTKDEQASILSHFIMGGQLTAGGVMNAVTSVAQTVIDADRANDLEASAVRALALAAA